MNRTATTFKVRSVTSGGNRSALRSYIDIMYGDVGFLRFAFNELLTCLLGGLPGAPGLYLRMKLYPLLLGACGRKVVFGRNLVLRHPHKIKLADGVILDDNVVVDAKGEDNEGIEIGRGAFIGRNSIIYCKSGDIHIGSAVSISSNCQVFSSNRVAIGEGTMIGAFSYLLSGGEYDYNDQTPFSEQSGKQTVGPLTIGANCWLGAHVTVLDGASIGEHCVLAAGAVVTKPIAADSLAAGVPARVIKSIPTTVSERKKDST